MRHFILCSLLIGATTAFTQSNEDFMTQTTRDRLNYTTVTSSVSTSLFTIKGPAGKLLGDPYIDTTWQAGTVKFYNRIGTSLTSDSQTNVPVRIDLNANEVEPKDIRAVKAAAVRYVDVGPSTGKSRFLNVNEYQFEGNSLSGFFEQIVNGKLQLLLHPSVYIRRANYNVAMNTGSKEDELMTLLELMADKKEQIEAYLKNEKPDLKSRAGLASVFMYYQTCSLPTTATIRVLYAFG